MTHFLDGPAKGKRLMLQRAPMFLRVTECGAEFDALDLWNDSARPEEKLHCYRLFENNGVAFVDGSKFRGRCTIASYRLFPDPPEDAVMRDNGAWTKWATETGTRLRREGK